MAAGTQQKVDPPLPCGKHRADETRHQHSNLDPPVTEGPWTDKRHSEIHEGQQQCLYKLQNKRPEQGNLKKTRNPGDQPRVPYS